MILSSNGFLSAIHYAEYDPLSSSAMVTDIGSGNLSIAVCVFMKGTARDQQWVFLDTISNFAKL